MNRLQVFFFLAAGIILSSAFPSNAAYRWIQNDVWTEGTPFNQVTNFEYCSAQVGDQVCTVLEITEDCVIDKIGVLFGGVTVAAEFHILIYDGTGTLPNPGKQIGCPCGVNVPFIVSGQGFLVFDLMDSQIRWQLPCKAGDKLVVCLLYMGALGGSGDANLDVCADSGNLLQHTTVMKRCETRASKWEFCETNGLTHNLVIRAGWYVPDPTVTPPQTP